MTSIIVFGQAIMSKPEVIIEGHLYWIGNLQVRVVKVQPLASVVQCSSPHDTSETIRVNKDKLTVQKIVVRKPYTHKLVWDGSKATIEAID